MIHSLRYAACLLSLLILGACSKEEEPLRTEVSPGVVRLACENGSTAVFTVSANVKWTLSYEQNGFSVTEGEGARGQTSVTVTAGQANESLQSRKLGNITIHSQAGDFQVEVYQKPAVAAQTLLLYMPGRDLIAAYEHNIEGIRAAVTSQVPGDGRILVCYQPDNHRSAVLEEIRYNATTNQCERETLETYTDFNAGSAANVRQMFEDAAEQAPAQRYGLIIGCHGKAWVPASSGAIPYAMRPGAEKRDDIWTPAPGAKQTRSFGDGGYELDIPELAAIFEALPFRFEYLVFDDCFMANIETLYDLRERVSYIVASPCEIMSDGFPYERIMPHLFTCGGASNDLEAVCREFWNLYENDYQSTTWKEQSGCISLAVTAELDALAAEMRRINERGKQAFDINELQYYKGGSTPLFYDLGHYVALSCGDQALVDDFTRQLEQAFPSACRLHTARFYSAYDRGNHTVHHYSGVSVSEPSTRYVTENRQTAWYRDTH